MSHWRHTRTRSARAKQKCHIAVSHHLVFGLGVASQIYNALQQTLMCAVIASIVRMAFAIVDRILPQAMLL